MASVFPPGAEMRLKIVPSRAQIGVEGSEAGDLQSQLRRTVPVAEEWIQNAFDALLE